MKSVCFIASDNVVIDGDVIFLNQYKFGSDVAVYLPSSVKMFTCTEKGLQIYAYGDSPKKGLKIKALWFWHMVILRKSHVYLTGVIE